MTLLFWTELLTYYGSPTYKRLSVKVGNLYDFFLGSFLLDSKSDLSDIAKDRSKPTAKI